MMLAEAMNIIRGVRDRKAGVSVKLAKFLRESNMIFEKIQKVNREKGEEMNANLWLDIIFHDIRCLKWYLDDCLNTAQSHEVKCKECGRPTL